MLYPHSTCECRVFCREIQSAIEAGRIKFDAPEKPMKIDGHPFPTNMVELKENDTDEGIKILTSGRAKRSRAVDPKAQASLNQLEGQGRYDQGRNFKRPHQRVTSQMLINKSSEREGITPVSRTSRARSKSLAVPKSNSITLNP